MYIIFERERAMRIKNISSIEPVMCAALVKLMLKGTRKKHATILDVILILTLNKV